MAVTGEQVYNLAMVLLGEMEDSGTINIADTVIYKAQAPSILTVLQTELLPNTQTPVVIDDLSQNLLLSDRMCLTALPYGLAAHLIAADDDSGIATFFNSRYEELKAKARVSAEPITDVYNVLDGLR